MLFPSSEEYLLDQQDKKIRELEIENDRLMQRTQNYFEELGLSPQEVKQFIDNPVNFPEDTHEQIVACKQKLEEMLKRDLANIRNLKQAKKNYSSLNLPNYAIFVR